MSLILIFHNDGTGTDDSANYNVSIKVNSKEISSRRIEGHRRSDGWEELVRKIVPCPSCAPIRGRK